MKSFLSRKNVILFIFFGNLLLWIFPSDVVELIARDRHTLLGRYSVEKMTLQIFVLLGSVITLSLLLTKTKQQLKKRCFFYMALFLFLPPCLLVVDLYGRFHRDLRYIDNKSGIRHRHPGEKYEIVHKDIPLAKRSYPNIAPGYPPVKCKLTIDKRGFRNLEEYENCDILALGDSFTEGSSVSDEDPWPIRLSKKSELSVYNLGMSGSNPQDYFVRLENIGLQLAPKNVICMIYEGNDFRGSGSVQDRVEKKTSWGKKLEFYFKSSPVIVSSKMLMINYLSSINAQGQVPGAEILSWLPLSFPPGDQAKHYAFAPKRLLSLYQTKEQFRETSGWKSVATALEKMKKLCLEKNIRLLIVYAPNVAHVALPLLRDKLPAEKVRSFLMIRSRTELPPGKKLLEELLLQIDSAETVLAEFCQDEEIEFISTTKTLRQKMAEGVQVYYSYDQHWTAEGHNVVAEQIYQYWKSEDISEK